LQVVENSEGDVVKADQAEELVAQRLQLLGQQAIPLFERALNNLNIIHKGHRKYYLQGLYRSLLWKDKRQVP
jgi:hypothetical protein